MPLRAPTVAVGPRTDRHELRHDEQRDALRALRRVRQARQHQVHDVLGHVVFAGGDEDLLAGQLVAAVGLRLGLRAQHAEVGAAMRLGQAHRPGPLARRHLRQVQVLLRLRTVLHQALVGADRQARIHRPRLVGRVLHLVERDLEQVRQPLAAVLGVGRQPLPAGLAERVVRLLEAGRRLHGLRRRVVGAAFLVADAVGRLQDVLAEPGRLLHDLVDGVDIQVGVARHLLQDVDRTEQLVQHELLVA